MKMNRPLTVSLSLLLLVAGCSDKATEPVAEIENIADSDTEAIINEVENVTSDMVVYDYRYDAMDRGNYDYYAKEVVIDVNYYEENELARGDVIAYKETTDVLFSLTRVIALPGEKVGIENGQIYIDGKKLNTFYGRAHRLGHDLEELKKMMNEGDYGLLQSKENVENNINHFENKSTEEITVPESHVYVIGDDWFRTPFFGALAKDKIAGKVQGYEKQE